MPDDPTTVIVIGPYAAGKSTIAELLAARLGRPTESLDLHQHYYQEGGFDPAEFRRLMRTAPPPAADLYFQTFFPAAVERLLADYPGHILDLGAGHTVYSDMALFARVQQALAPYPHVVLILPSPDPEESIRVLRERAAQRPGAEYFLDSPFDFFRHWVTSPCNAALAKITLYTAGQTPEETAATVLAALGPGADQAEGPAG